MEIIITIAINNIFIGHFKPRKTGKTNKTKHLTLRLNYRLTFSHCIIWAHADEKEEEREREHKFIWKENKQNGKIATKKHHWTKLGILSFSHTQLVYGNEFVEVFDIHNFQLDTISVTYMFIAGAFERSTLFSRD